jgi:hypothetical protein
VSIDSALLITQDVETRRRSSSRLRQGFVEVARLRSPEMRCEFDILDIRTCRCWSVHSTNNKVSGCPACILAAAGRNVSGWQLSFHAADQIAWFSPLFARAPPAKGTLTDRQTDESTNMHTYMYSASYSHLVCMLLWLSVLRTQTQLALLNIATNVVKSRTWLRNSTSQLRR